MDTAVIHAPPAPAFLMTQQELRARSNGKWSLYGPDVLPAFVAEMDFRVAEPIARVTNRMIGQCDFGYPMKSTVSLLAEAFNAHMASRHGWSPDPAQVVALADLVQGLYTQIAAWTDPGDGVLLHVPCYPPLRNSIEATGRLPVPVTMRDTGTGYGFDPDEIRAGIGPRTRLFFLCNPQNPTGRVFDRDELMQIARIAIEHDLIVVADEIHADLVYRGKTHIPFASLGPEVAARTVTLFSATKGFNVPGLRTAMMHFGSADLQERFHRRIPAKLLGRCNSIGVEATIAALTEGQPWMQQVLAHLEAMRDRLDGLIARRLPGVRWHKPEATFLAWLDFSALDLGETAFDYFLRHARVGMSPGQDFSAASGSFGRLNFATSGDILDEMIDRMARSLG